MENLNLSLPLTTLTLLILHCTAFHLFFNHRCYLKNIFHSKTFPNWAFEICFKSSIFSTLSRWGLLLQNNGNMNFCIKLNMHETKAQNLVNNKSTRTTWMMLFWCLYQQLQRWGYWGPSWTFTNELFFAIQWTKAKTYNWVLNTPLKLWADFTLTTWLWFGYLTWEFSASSWAHLFKPFDA